MSHAAKDNPHHCFEIKSADLSLVAFVLKSHDISDVVNALSSKMAENPGFFDQQSVVIDVSGLPQSDGTAVDLALLSSALKKFGILPLAIKGANEATLSVAKGIGLVDASDARIRRDRAFVDDIPQEAAPVPMVKPSELPLGALIIDKPLRSGQQVYAKGRDLIVLAMVNAGAEVIADGHIHVYASLRGKAIAGARGNVNAQIFALSMAPELISIAGVYRTSENSLPNDVVGKMAHICLQSGPDGDKLLITPLKP